MSSATAGEPVPPEDRTLLADAYAAYNRRDVEGLLALVSDNVDWPDGARRLHGKEALRAYWTEQWTRTSTHDEPVSFTRRNDGRIAVGLRQVVRSLDGSVLSQGEPTYLHVIEAGQIARLEIEGTVSG